VTGRDRRKPTLPEAIAGESYPALEKLHRRTDPLSRRRLCPRDDSRKASKLNFAALLIQFFGHPYIALT
jgi:hypothetical protein